MRRFISRSMGRASAAAVVLAALVALPAPAGSLDVGDRLGRLDLVDRSGTRVTLADLDGKIAILDFWASWCAACRPTLGFLDGLARRYGEAGLVVLGVNADEDRADAEEFLDERFPRSAIRFVYDPGRWLLSAAGVDGFPALLLLDRRQVVRAVESGFSVAEMARVEREVNRLLGTRPLSGHARDEGAR